MSLNFSNYKNIKFMHSGNNNDATVTLLYKDLALHFRHVALSLPFVVLLPCEEII